MSASLTTGDAELDFAATADAFQRAQQRLVNEVFCGGRAKSADETADPTQPTC
ncbi:hypothetical protein WKI65_24410 [Streptomyces sp. MS1.AVA.3]|uniref:hypothetical protein n=1 Tax=Streptomyces decoyicus TaxID=249567 RepID=UPI0030C2CECE